MDKIDENIKVTVVFPLYNAAENVLRLLDCLHKQIHPLHKNQNHWLKAVFIDDASSDNTVALLKEGLALLNNPSHYQLIENPKNLGLSQSLNKAFSYANTQYISTCQCDCFYIKEDYVYTMLRLIDSHPKVAAITGQPKVDFTKSIPFAERLNLVANLMDIFPDNSEDELISVGFAEGRCDIFRVKAFEEVNFYDTNLRISGEDQVICRKLKKMGYEICQAPKNEYYLSASNEQNSFYKLLMHQKLFAKTQPYILSTSSGSGVNTIIGKSAGKNRNLRTILRGSQLLFSLLYFIVFFIGIFWSWSLLGVSILILFLFKLFLFYRHLKVVPFNFYEKITFFISQPLFDLYYTLGFIQGIFFMLQKKRDEKNKLNNNTISNISFDPFAIDYETHHNNSLPFGVKSEEFLVQKIQYVLSISQNIFKDKNISILDFGCGNGRLAEGLSDWNKLKSYVGIDDSSATLNEARLKLKDKHNFSFQEKLTSLKEAQSRFDIILLFNVMHHVNRENRKELVQLLRNFLSDEGIILVWEHNPYNFLTRLLVKLCPFDKGVKLLTQKYTKNLFSDSGLINIHSEYVNITPPSLQRFSWIRSLEHLLKNYPFGAQYRSIFKLTHPPL